MARPANSPVVDSGVLKRLPGLPNTATALILPARPGSSAGAEPNSPTVLPSGGTPASTDTALFSELARVTVGAGAASPATVSIDAVAAWLFYFAPPASSWTVTEAGMFGGATAATILRALIDHPQRAGDPLALTVNYCALIAEGAFDLDVRLVKANRSTQHWYVEMTQGGDDVVTLATAVFAERRPSWSHQQAQFPQATPFEQIFPYTKVAAPWIKQYDFRFAEGEPKFGTSPQAVPQNAFTKWWIGDKVPRKIDLLSLTSMSDAFFGRVFHARQELVPFGTVSLTTYFHTSADELATEDISRVLATADAKIFHRSYGDQSGELWSPNGRLLATTQQIAYFKA